MAYKNQKKNKLHQAKVRKANSAKKHSRELQRNQRDVKVMTENDYHRLMRLQGLI